MPEIVTVAQRPDLARAIAPWLWTEWERRLGRSLADTTASIAARTAAIGPEQCFILLDGAEPAATASLYRDDLDDRPDLTPWLAAVFVHPDFRGRGHALRVIAAVVAACRAAAIPTLWLHTEHAAELYARLGWEALGAADDAGHAVTLMRRHL